jgi:hypothetical protein
MNSSGVGWPGWSQCVMDMEAMSMLRKLRVWMQKLSAADARNSKLVLRTNRLTACAKLVRVVHRSKKKPSAEQVLLTLIGDEVAGDPVSGDRWIRRSLRSLPRALVEQGERLSHETIRRLLHKISPKANVKRLTPEPHPDRDHQFGYIQSQRQQFQRAGWPIISVDAKQKELIGLFRNAGQVCCHAPTAVYLHDFPQDALGRAIPYGIYDVQVNRGYMYVGQSADTPDFAVDCIAHWWQHWGRNLYPTAPELLILADGGGSNGYRPRRWKYQLQLRLADPFALKVTVCHYPKGASKWNPIEHRLFSEISKTWAGTPLTSFAVALEAMRRTSTATGLVVEATFIEQTYELGLSVSDDLMQTLALYRHQTCPAWNYSLSPRQTG